MEPHTDSVIGHTFGRLTVLEHITGGRHQEYRCRCACGRTTTIRVYDLGKTQSCGCLAVETGRKMMAKLNIKHGLSNTPEARIWIAMKARCLNPKQSRYPRYGGRGIKVCDRWLHDFPAFYADMGPRPTPQHSIDRIDNNGNYEPGNCRWATPKEQGRNNRRNHLLTLNQVSRPISEWAEVLNISEGTIYTRLHKGWPDERVLEVEA